MSGRTAQPIELAPAFVLLASDESSFINGEVLGVTDGELMLISDSISTSVRTASS